DEFPLVLSQSSTPQCRGVAALPSRPQQRSCVMFKFVLSVGLILGSLAGISAARADELGTTWTVHEGTGVEGTTGGTWTGTWTRIGNSNRFNAVWEGPGGTKVTGKVEISISGNRVRAVRVKSSDGFTGATYVGKLNRDGKYEGTYSLGGGKWWAEVR